MSERFSIETKRDAILFFVKKRPDANILFSVQSKGTAQRKECATQRTENESHTSLIKAQCVLWKA